MFTIEDTTPRVWVGCLACYNGGTLRGEWVSADEAEDFEACTLPTHDEFWCMDYDGEWAGFMSGECSPSQATEYAELLETWENVATIHGIPLPVLVEVASDGNGGDWRQLVDPEDYADRYRGAYRDEADFTYDQVHEALECGGVEVPSWVSIDYQHTWDGALRFDHTVVWHDGQAHIFWSH